MGLGSQRGIAWRLADSRSLRAFLYVGRFVGTSDHTSLKEVRWRLLREVFDEVFSFVLGIVAGRGLLSDEVMDGDATTLEANASMKSIVRRDDDDEYEPSMRELYPEDQHSPRCVR